MKIFLTTILVCVTSVVLFGQKNTYKGLPSLVWPKLYDIEYTKSKDDLGEFEKPVFSAAAKSLAGKEVVLPGYMMPFESGLSGKHLMLSSLPINACFFCGVGGPESVVEVYLKTPISFTEKPIEVRGKLKLNDQDPDKMIYILEDAEFLGEIDF